MDQSSNQNESIKNILSTAKTIAMVGVSSIKKEESTNINRRPSIKALNSDEFKALLLMPLL